MGPPSPVPETRSQSPGPCKTSPAARSEASPSKIFLNPALKWRTATGQQHLKLMAEVQKERTAAVLGGEFYVYVAVRH